MKSCFMPMTSVLVVVFLVSASLPATGWSQPPESGTVSQPSVKSSDSTDDVTTDTTATSDQDETVKATVEPERPQPPIDPTWKRLSRVAPIWIDKENQTVVIGGEICHRDGPLEMFACPRNTKEHESVVVVNCKAFLVHTALLATGSRPGRPVRFSPYQAASGPVIDIFVEWLDERGKKQRARAQDWIKHMPTGKSMTQEWVFAGSGFWVDEETNDRHYLAEGGELICVSNFSTATLDLNIRSSGENASLMFGAFAERIPPLGTKVHVLLVPKQPAKPAEPKVKSPGG